MPCWFSGGGKNGIQAPCNIVPSSLLISTIYRLYIIRYERTHQGSSVPLLPTKNQ